MTLWWQGGAAQLYGTIQEVSSSILNWEVTQYTGMVKKQFRKDLAGATSIQCVGVTGRLSGEVAGSRKLSYRELNRMHHPRTRPPSPPRCDARPTSPCASSASGRATRSASLFDQLYRSVELLAESLVHQQKRRFSRWVYRSHQLS